MPKTADIRAVGEFAASRYGVITTKQAVEYGISKGVLDRLRCDGTLEQCRSNVYRFVAHPMTWRQELYVATVEKRAAASLLSAAALHIIDGWTNAPHVPQVMCHHESRVRVPGADVHRTRAFADTDIIMVDGIACTTLARTVIDLRPLVGHSGMMRMLDDLQRRGASMQWVLNRAQLLLAKGWSGP